MQITDATLAFSGNQYRALLITSSYVCDQDTTSAGALLTAWNIASYVALSHQSQGAPCSSSISPNALGVLDGGGVREIATITFLSKLEKEYLKIENNYMKKKTCTELRKMNQKPVN